MTNEEKIKKLPHDKLVNFKRIYDGFEKKDMPFADFVCALMGLQDEAQMEKDLEDILASKATFARNKAMIEGTFE